MEEQEAPIGYVVLTAGQRRWMTFIARTGLREVLFFLDCSVPGTRGRLRRLHSPGLPLPPRSGAG